MDLQNFLVNKPLLLELSKEYELLKKSGAEVDYDAWIKQRLCEAATREAIGQQKQQTDNEPSSSSVDPTHLGGDNPRTDARIPAVQPAGANMLQYSHRNQKHHAENYNQQGAHEGVPPYPGSLVFALPGEGPSSMSTGPLVTMHAPSIPHQGKQDRRRPVWAVPQAAVQPAVGPKDMYQHVSKLYTQPAHGKENSMLSAPETNVHPYYSNTRGIQGHAPQQRAGPSAAAAIARGGGGRQPSWAQAASLQAALHNSRSVVPHLQAAAERDRRLAHTSALVRQKLQQDAAAGTSSAQAELSRLQYDHVMHLAQQLARQNELLASDLTSTKAQLQQQYDLIQDIVKGQAKVAENRGEQQLGGPPRINKDVPNAWFIQPSGAEQGGGGVEPKGGRLTLKQRDRMVRKEQLKMVLKQVLAGGGRGVKKAEDPVAAASEVERLVYAMRVLVARPTAQGIQQQQAVQPAPARPMQPGKAPAPVPEPNMQKDGQWSAAEHSSSQATVAGSSSRGRSSSDGGSGTSSRSKGHSAAGLEVPEQAARHSGPAQVLAAHPAEAPAGLPAHAPPAWPGVNAAAIEEEAMRVLQSDAKKAEEQARMKQIEQLEERMMLLVARVETQLSKVPEVQQGPPLEQQQQRVSPQPRPLRATPAPQQPAADSLPGPSLLELQQLMLSLQHMENKENEIRRRWLLPCTGGDDPVPPGSKAPVAAQPLVVQDGMIGTLFPATGKQQATHTIASLSAPVHQHLRTPQPFMVQSPPKEAGGSMVPSQATTQHASATVDHVSEEMLAAVLANRRRFLKYQQQKDGELMASSDPQLDPVQIVEDVVDMLIDDMLHEHALELFDMCDKLGEQLFESEFKDPQPQAAEEGADLAGVHGS